MNLPTVSRETPQGEEPVLNEPHLPPRQIEVGNEWVVPYLSSQFDCHLNFELCSSVKSIKYVIKYVHKGSDQAVFALQRVDQDGNVIDEILMYQNARYIGSIEACWRLLGFGVHDRSPAVVRLAVHLPNGQRVTFNENNINEVAAGNPPKTTLTEFFTLCSNDPFAQTLRYRDVPQHYTWKQGSKKWERRINEHVKSLGRVYAVSPKNKECYYVRLLLTHRRGPKSFLDLRTVEGVVYPDFRSACLALGLLESDEHWKSALT